VGDVAAFTHKLGTFGIRYGVEDPEVEDLRETSEMANIADVP
jgi:hypothetical protein